MRVIRFPAFATGYIRYKYARMSLMMGKLPTSSENSAIVCRAASIVQIANDCDCENSDRSTNDIKWPRHFAFRVQLEIIAIIPLRRSLFHL